MVHIYNIMMGKSRIQHKSLRNVDETCYASLKVFSVRLSSYYTHIHISHTHYVQTIIPTC